MSVGSWTIRGLPEVRLIHPDAHRHVVALVTGPLTIELTDLNGFIAGLENMGRALELCHDFDLKGDSGYAIYRHKTEPVRAFIDSRNDGIVTLLCWLPGEVSPRRVKYSEADFEKEWEPV